jgi:cystathionine beta-lyase
LCAGDQPAQGPVHSAGLAAALLGLRLDPAISQAQLDTFCDALRLFKLGFSWGGPMSLVVPYQKQNIRTLPAPHLKPGTVVRFCIGFEDVVDLQADIKQAIHAALV